MNPKVSSDDKVPDRIWRAFANPTSTMALVVWSIAGMALAIWASQPGPRERLLDASTHSPVVERVVSFLDLHWPWTSWWLLLLLGSLGLSLLATLLEHQGPLAAWLQRHAGKAGKVRPGLAVAVRAVVDAFGDDVRVTVGRGRVAVARPDRRLRVGLMVLGAGVLTFWGAGLLETRLGVAGEMLLVPGAPADSVQMPGPAGRVEVRDAGFALTLTSVSPTGTSAEADLDGETIHLEPGVPVQVAGRTLVARAARRAAGGETYRLKAWPADGGEATPFVVSGRESLELASDDGTTWEVLGHQLDLNGLGPAIQMNRTAPDGTEDLFWVLQRNPDFDRRNRTDAWNFTLESIAPRYELIVAVLWHPGLIPGVLAIILLLVGGILVLLGGRATPVVVFDDQVAFGAPSTEATVVQALSALEKAA